MSRSIKIERGVKQGDALSCAIFILCIDPLLRNINENENIIRIQIKHKNTKFLDELKFKGSAFADDVSIVCMKTRKSIQAVFSEYEKLTRMSGLELNAEKTEILVMNLNESEELQFKYLGKKFRVQSVNRIKICGLIYGTDLNDEYKSNVVDKITKMEYKMKLWSHRNLSMEGKALIAKTFGISQIIYNMQSYPFDKGEIVSAERALFNFLWSTSKNNRGIDRIKRFILKNDYSEGGLKITDIECLNRSLKLRQFIRAFDSKHEIAKIQSLLSEKGRNRIEYEYSNVSEDEDICKSAQNTINEITDYNRKAYCTEEFEDDPLVVEEISSTDLNTYLSRKKKVFHVCMLKNITKLGIRSVGELIREYEVEINENTSKMMKMILCIFPTKLIELAEKFQEDTNSEREDCQFVRLEKNTWKSIKTVTTKDLQHLLKKVLNKLETADFCTKHNIDDFDKENTILFRQNCRNPKLRNIYFRLIHGDFYTNKKNEEIQDGRFRKLSKMRKYRRFETSCVQLQSCKQNVEPL